MKRKLENMVPPGAELQQELKWIKTGLFISFLFSLIYFINLMNEYQSLFVTVGHKKLLIDGVIMKDFVDILGSSLIGFFIVALGMIAVLVYHFLYHYQGSKSIYLMKRLPDRWELWRRCLSLPVLTAGLSLCTFAVLLIAYFGIYMAVTPESCLLPNQWNKIWDAYFKSGMFI